MPALTLLSVNLGVRTEAAWAELGWSGIDKRPASGRLHLTELGLAGDGIADTRHHGGADKAVYAYACEDAAWWESELDQPIRAGGLGENLTTEGLDITGAVIGERWAIGTAVLQVCQPRTPCRTFAGFRGVPDLIRRFTERAWPGAYLRVVQAGDVGAGDPVTVLDRPGHGVTVGEVFRAVNSDPSLLPRLLEAPELPAALREKAKRRVSGSRTPAR